MNTAQQIQVSPATAAGFDLDGLDNNASNVTFDVVFAKDENGDPVSGFRIVGKNSAEYQAASNEIRVANIMRASKRQKSIDTSTEEGAKQVAKQVADNNRTEAIAVVVDWFGFNANGVAKQFDKAIAAQLLTKYPTWVDQIQSALSDDANFLKV